MLKVSIKMPAAMCGILSILGACSGASSSKPATIPADAVRVESVALNVDSDRARELESIQESLPTNTRRVWLKKSFWLNRKIFLSLGVERASTTGLATSVMGYLPATLKQVGDALVLERDPKGLFGGSVLAPEITINAYPILSERETEILVDFAAPKTPYGLSLTGLHAGANASAELQPRLEYTKKVEVGESSLSFTNVSTVKSTQPLFDPEGGSAEAAAGLDPFLLSLTLRVDWIVAPSESDLAPLNAALSSALGFFMTDPLVTDGGTKTARFAQRIRTTRAFDWALSASTPEAYRGSVEEGLLAWNSALGQATLRVQRASADRSVVDPSASNLVWDDNRAVGMAFANWRTNPYTGEILQAQIYMSGDMWAAQAATVYKLRATEKKLRDSRAASAASGAGAGATAPAPSAPASLRLPRLTPLLTRGKSSSDVRHLALGFNSALARESAQGGAWCLRPIERNELEAGLEELESAALNADPSGVATAPLAALPANDPHAHLPYVPEGMKLEEFQRAVIRGVVMHEAGHTLGLRHNFNGSLASSEEGRIESGSVMDYNDLVVDAAFTRPGALDLTAVKAAYAGGPALNAKDFCTDEDADKAPDCFRFDGFGQPEDYFRVKQESELIVGLRLAQAGFTKDALNLVVTSIKSIAPLTEMLLTPTPDEAFARRQTRALKILESARGLQGVAWPADLQEEYQGLVIQILASGVNARAEESAAIGEVAALLQGALVNADGKQSFATRRAALEGLRRLQSARGRMSVRMAQSSLARKVEAATAKAASAGLDGAAATALMEDEDLLQSIQGLLEAGYFKAAAAK